MGDGEKEEEKSRRGRTQQREESELDLRQRACFDLTCSPRSRLFHGESDVFRRMRGRRRVRRCVDTVERKRMDGSQRGEREERREVEMVERRGSTNVEEDGGRRVERGHLR